MAEPEQRGHAGVALWGSFLLVLGTVFILQTTDALPWTLWVELWRFWPAVLIVAGIALLMRRSSFWLVTLVSLVAFGGSVGIAIGQHGPVVEANVTSAFVTVPLGDATSADVIIDFDAVAVDIGSLPAASSNLAEIESDEINGQPRLRLDTADLSGGVTELHLRTADLSFSAFDWDGTDGWSRWQIDLARGIPLDLQIELAAGDVDVDLTELDVTRLTVDMAAGSLEVFLPAAAGDTEVVIDAAAANVVIRVPDGVAARITADAAFGATDIDTRRFPRKGGGYESDDYADAENRVDITINVSFGRVAVR